MPINWKSVGGLEGADPIAALALGQRGPESSSYSLSLLNDMVKGTVKKRQQDITGSDLSRMLMTLNGATPEELQRQGAEFFGTVNPDSDEFKLLEQFRNLQTDAEARATGKSGRGLTDAQALQARLEAQRVRRGLPYVERTAEAVLAEHAAATGASNAAARASDADTARIEGETEEAYQERLRVQANRNKLKQLDAKAAEVRQSFYQRGQELNATNPSREDAEQNANIYTDTQWDAYLSSPEVTALRAEYGDELFGQSILGQDVEDARAFATKVALQDWKAGTAKREEQTKQELAMNGPEGWSGIVFGPDGTPGRAEDLSKEARAMNQLEPNGGYMSVFGRILGEVPGLDITEYWDDMDPEERDVLKTMGGMFKNNLSAYEYVIRNHMNKKNGKINFNAMNSAASKTYEDMKTFAATLTPAAMLQQEVADENAPNGVNLGEPNEAPAATAEDAAVSAEKLDAAMTSKKMGIPEVMELIKQVEGSDTLGLSKASYLNALRGVLQSGLGGEDMGPAIERVQSSMLEAMEKERVHQEFLKEKGPGAAMGNQAAQNWQNYWGEYLKKKKAQEAEAK